MLQLFTSVAVLVPKLTVNRGIWRLCHQNVIGGCKFHNLDYYAFIPVYWYSFCGVWGGGGIFVINAKS